MQKSSMQKKLSDTDYFNLLESRFWLEYHAQYVIDNGMRVSLSYYILKICIEDIDLYLRQNKKPYPEWRLQIVKEYFNFKRRSPELLELLRDIKSIIDEKI